MIPTGFSQLVACAVFDELEFSCNFGFNVQDFDLVERKNAIAKGWIPADAHCLPIDTIRPICRVFSQTRSARYDVPAQAARSGLHVNS
jgi:hypothetical protein